MRLVLVFNTSSLEPLTLAYQMCMLRLMGCRNALELAYYLLEDVQGCIGTMTF
jgi:hypothetical protein